jgi:hypothetical protein
MCVSTTIRTGANTGWEMVMVADACDCMELPDAIGGGIIPADEIHRVHVATLAAEFCRVVGTKDLCVVRPREAYRNGEGRRDGT